MAALQCALSAVEGWLHGAPHGDADGDDDAAGDKHKRGSQHSTSARKAPQPLTEPEPNPFLGWRGICVSIARPAMFL